MIQVLLPHLVKHAPVLPHLFFLELKFVQLLRETRNLRLHFRNKTYFTSSQPRTDLSNIVCKSSRRPFKNLKYKLYNGTHLKKNYSSVEAYTQYNYTKLNNPKVYIYEHNVAKINQSAKSQSFCNTLSSFISFASLH